MFTIFYIMFMCMFTYIIVQTATLYSLSISWNSKQNNLINKLEKNLTTFSEDEGELIGSSDHLFGYR